MTAEEPKVTTISEKGQVVIPQSIRKELGIKPKNKFLVYGRGDTIIMKKLELPSLKKEWEDIFKLMDKKALKISDEEIQNEVAAARKAKQMI
ncbi:MAG: AbrB/MazE/SpoVT family DNA-binding domain-containing protein [Candidatus Bathyarchaeia archaeon]|jgi:AbrB family looped-hinge helix DNA binding protein